MTFPRLSFVTLITLLGTTPALAQVTTANPEGPTITIDVQRIAGPGSSPVIDPLTGGITYIVSVTPDDSFPTFTPEGAGLLGPGGSIAVQLGFLVGGAGLSDDLPVPIDTLPSDPSGLVVVNVNSSPGVGSTATEPDDGIVDFAIPGFPIFGFETPEIDTTGDGIPDFPLGIDVGIDDETGQDAVFAALGTTFIDASTIGDAPFELFRIRTAGLDFSSPDSLAPSLTLVNGSITSQSIDLSGAIPVSENFLLPETASEPIFVGDVVPEPTSALLLTMAMISFTVVRKRRAKI